MSDDTLILDKKRAIQEELKDKLSDFVNCLNYDTLADFMVEYCDLVKDYKSILLLHILARKNADSKAILAKKYYSGIELLENRDKGIFLLKAAADDDSLIANYELCWHYYYDNEYDNAIKYGKELVGLVKDTSNYAGECYTCIGDSYKKLGEYEKSIEYLTIAAEKYNSGYSFNRLAEIYMDIPEFIDKEKAIHCLECASKLGDEDATYKLGKLFLFGEDKLAIYVNRKKAERYFSLIADVEKVGIQFSLGILYATSDTQNGFFEDKAKACIHLERAFRLSPDHMIANALGHEYFYTERYAEAESMLLLARSKGEKSNVHLLGQIYHKGLAGKVDIGRALVYYKESYVNGWLKNAYLCSEFVDLLIESKEYELAYEVATYGNSIESDKYFMIAQATLVLSGLVYGKMSIEHAVNILEFCTEYGKEGGKVHITLGLYYHNTLDYRKAESHFLEAFNKGCSDAGVYLGYLYEDGGGTINPNTKKAYEWFTLAAEKGSSIAKEELECWKKNLFGGYHRIRGKINGFR